MQDESPQAAGKLEKSIAIIGMSCIFPGAPDLETYWSNIKNGVDSIREAGENEWNSTFYKSKSVDSFGRIYCSRGGFISEYASFDPLEFGIMPSSLRGSDPDQFLALATAAAALQDAGYSHRSFDNDRAEIIIGRTMAPGIGSLNLIQHGQTIDQVIDVLKACLPDLQAGELAAVASRLKEELQPCNADTIPAVMPNVLSGRIAAKLGFRGRNLILDAACASSLIAVETAVQGLQTGLSDLAIAGGVHINSSPYFYQMFCELGALSQSSAIRPFDDNADGTILGEGVGMIVLKRYADAVRDGNRIYALIRGVGSSSDGRGGGSLAPSVDGEALAMRRAYESAGVSPATVELLETHGTGTRAGDRAEMKAVEQVFCSNGDRQKAWCAIGSVKSNIGHTQAASGIAGLIKTALCLHHKILPATMNVQKPSKDIDWETSPCYINDKCKDWTAKQNNRVNVARRAAVSAFGFGGVNAHAVLEEFVYSDKARTEDKKPSSTKSSRAEKSQKLSLRYPALSGKNLSKIQMTKKQEVPSMPASVGRQPKPLDPAGRSADSQEKLQSEMMRSYLETLGSFQKNLLSVQENVMLGYLQEARVLSVEQKSSDE